jgi:DeoR family transcriptional regulator of aga operon
VAVDGAKFGRAALAVVCEMADVDVVVTDSHAPKESVTALEDAGVDVRRV